MWCGFFSAISYSWSIDVKNDLYAQCTNGQWSTVKTIGNFSIAIVGKYLFTIYEFGEQSEHLVKKKHTHQRFKNLEKVLMYIY